MSRDIGPGWNAAMSLNTEFGRCLATRIASEVEPESQPEQIAALLKAAGAELDGVAELAAQPEDIYFFTFIPIPPTPSSVVRAWLDQEVRVGEAGREDFFAEASIR